MGSICKLVLLVSTFYLLTADHSPAEALPAPGHLAIPYYREQKKELLRKENDKLRIRCQSYIESGYYSDPRCEELYLQTFSNYSASPGSASPSLLLTSILCLLTALFRV